MFLLLGATMANEEAIPPSIVETSAEENYENAILIPCSICGRTFKSESLQKHQAVCQKNATKKRRVFDSMKQRIQGTELAEYIPIPVVPSKPKLIPINKAAAKKLSKDDHRTAESPNVVQHASTEKTPVRPAVTRSNSTTAVHVASRSGGGALREERCPHCDRTFGWKAFSRHEEWCREHKSRLAQAHSPAAVLKAKEMLAARIKYRAPALGKSKRPTNREKYSGGTHCSPAVHSVHKLSADESPVLSSMKATVSSSNKVVSESRTRVVSKGSMVQTPTAHQGTTPSTCGPGSTPRRGISPSKKISHVIHNPWKPNINVDQGPGGDQILSPPPSARSNPTLGSGGDSNCQEDDDDGSVFDRLPVLEYCEDNDKDEKLMEWISNLKGMLKQQSKVHSREENKDKPIESPVSPLEVEKECRWEIKSTSSDERMKRKFVYKALDSSDESFNCKVVVSSEKLSSWNEKVSVHELKENEKWTKSDDLKKVRGDPPADNNQAFDGPKIEAVPQISTNSEITWGSHGEGLSIHSKKKVKSGKINKSKPKVVTSSVTHDVSVSANICSGSSNVGTTKMVLTDSYPEGMVDRGERKKEDIFKKRSKLPIPVPKFCVHQKSKIDVTAKDCVKKRMVDDLSTDFMVTLPKCSLKNLNNTFILSKQTLVECGFGDQQQCNKVAPEEIQMDSLESSSSDSSPLLRKGIIHKCGPEMFESCTSARKCKTLGRNESARKHSPCSEEHDAEETCSVPHHLLVRNNDSSLENSSVTECGDDFNDKDHGGQEDLFEVAYWQSPPETETKDGESPVEFSDAEAQTVDDLSGCHSENLTKGKGTVGSPHSYLSLFDNRLDSPLAVEDLATDSPTRSKRYPNSKMPNVISCEKDIELGVTSSCPSIKMHYHQNDDSEEAHCSERRRANSNRRLSPSLSHEVEVVHFKDSYESPKSSRVETPHLAFNEEPVVPDNKTLEGSHKHNRNSCASNILSTHQKNSSSMKGSSEDFPRRRLRNGQSKKRSICRKGGGKRKTTSQKLGSSLVSEYPEDLGDGRLNMGRMGNGIESSPSHTEEIGMNTESLVDKMCEEMLESGKHLDIAKSKLRKDEIIPRKSPSLISVQSCSSKGNLSVGGTTYENSSVSYNVPSCESFHSRENMLGTLVSSRSTPVHLHSNQGSSSKLEMSKQESLISTLSKYTMSLQDPAYTSPKSKVRTQDCSMVVNDESSVALLKISRKGWLRNQKHRGGETSSNKGSGQGRSECETARMSNERPCPEDDALLVQSGNGRSALEDDVDFGETCTGRLPTIKAGNHLGGEISPQKSAENMASTQLRWLNLIRKFSESEVNCVESLEEINEMSNSSESIFPQRKEALEKSRGIGFTRSDHKAAKDRVKSRLRRSNHEDSPMCQEHPSPAYTQSLLSCSRRMVVLPPMEALPKMDANNKASISLPLSLLPPPPNQKPLLSSPLLKSSEEKKKDGEVNESIAVPSPSRHSTYDPFSRAEMQLKELLSDGSEAQKHVVDPAATLAMKHPDAGPKETLQNGAHEKPVNVSAKTNGNINIHEVCTNQKQAKEVELPDLFTEMSTQLDFEMPNLMRGRDRCINTKRRALKPTAQNMGIELNSIGRDSSVGRRAPPAAELPKNTSNKFEDEEVEQITSLMNMGFCIPRISSRGNAKCNPGDKLDIDSIHQSINLVALGLTNLSATSQEFLADKDNNNERGRGVGCEQVGRGESSGDSDSEGGGRRVPRRVRVRSRVVVEEVVGVDAARERGSSHESLTVTQTLSSGKPAVDSAYSSLNRPTFRTIEQDKEDMSKAFDLPHHATSSEGENDQADEWSDDEGARKENQNRWNAENAESSTAVKYAKFCHNCGSKYPLTAAKFCCVCGAQRLAV